jgi:Protein of unknown function (DUF3237)
MTHEFADDVPGVLREVVTGPLFVMRLSVKPLQIVGATPGLFRRIGVVPGGSFFGDRLSGQVLEGGADWQTVRGDGTTTLDVRLTLKTIDGDLIAMSYRGLRRGARDTLERIDRGEAVDPAAYYFRIAPVFETASREHAWLNDILTVGLGYRYADGVMYSVFEVR